VCLYPKLILNRKYLPNKKNGGNIPEMKDERTRYVPIGCGRCMECRKQKSRGWQVRLHEELRNNRRCRFVTLSFSNQALIDLEKDLDCNLNGYELENRVVTLAVRRFLERWRKKYKTSVKHWLITELGQNATERIHLHGLIFTDASREQIEEIWQYGNTWIGDYVSERTINYIVKYITKGDQKHKYYTPKILCSKGIGSNYMNRLDCKLNEYREKKTNELYITRNGLKLPLPIYYRNKIYDDEQREKLWCQLLDKETRYINGIKIDISRGEQDYWNVLQKERIWNKQLGYGDDQTDEEARKYEQRLRNLKRLQRIAREKRETEASYFP